MSLSVFSRQSNEIDLLRMLVYAAASDAWRRKKLNILCNIVHSVLMSRGKRESLRED